MNYPTKIIRFVDEYDFLSNFYPSKVFLNDIGKDKDRVYYKTVEHAYQASKTLNPKIRSKVKRKHGPGQAKQFGRTIILRDDWDNIKVDIMYKIVFRKFIHNKELRDKLLRTGKAKLIEGNYWNDKFWGVCLKTEVGDNNLGKILMSIRSMIRKNINNKAWFRRSLDA